jgi:hypothetical protein
MSWQMRDGSFAVVLRSSRSEKENDMQRLALEPVGFRQPDPWPGDDGVTLVESATAPALSANRCPFATDGRQTLPANPRSAAAVPLSALPFPHLQVLTS